jgi:hypothetical protein
MALCVARTLIAFIPLRWWRNSLGGAARAPTIGNAELALRLAGQIERAATWLPFEVKCLPQAMALSWLLQWSRIPHVLIVAARPAHSRGGADALHAWVEVEGAKVLGDLPGPWLETLRLGELHQGTGGPVSR